MGRPVITDAEIRGRLLAKFYEMRLSNGGYVPVDDLTLSGTEYVSGDAIRVVCEQLSELGLIHWTAYMGEGPPFGSAKITMNGGKAVELGSWAGVDITFPGRAPVPERKMGGLKRHPELIQTLLEKLEAYPAEYGDAFTLNGDDPLLAVEGFTSGQINYHLEQLLKMGLVEDPGSQPAIGITFSGLSPRGHNVLERGRAVVSPPVKLLETQTMTKKVFLVHGHDEAEK